MMHSISITLVENDYQFQTGDRLKIQTGGYNILRIWDLTQGIDSAIIAP